MNSKIISIIAICAAVVAAAVAGVVVMNDRAAIARANATRAESEEAAAASEAKRARSEEAAALANAAAKEDEAKAAEENRKAKEAALETERLAGERAKEEAAKSKSDAEAAKARAREAADLRAAEKAKSDAVKAEASAEAAAAALERERLASEKTIAEAKLYELKQADLVSLERELLEWQRDLNEREEALRPEKTAADLTWVGEREADVIGGETNRVRRVAKPLPENDPELPRASRLLARAERLSLEEDAARASASSNMVVSALERLYLDALREDRVVDAQFYLKSIRTYYPGWRYTPPAPENPAENEAKKEEEGQ